MKKIWKILLSLLCLILALALSLDIRKLDGGDSPARPGRFDAAAFAEEFWETKLPRCISEATPVTDLSALLRTRPDEAFRTLGRTLGISKTYYFLVKGNGVIEEITGENLLVDTGAGTRASLSTLYLFGNAVRDGSGMVDINDFLNMMDFNQVSVEINRRIRERIVMPALPSLHPGQAIRFAGAAEINSKQFMPETISLIPLQITPADDLLQP